MKKLTLLCAALIVTGWSVAQEKKDPTFEEVLSLQTIRSENISPSGNNVLFTIGSTDWQENRYDTEIWISKNGSEPFQLTNNVSGSSTSPKWSPDGKWIAFLAKKDKETQIQLMRYDGGESFQFTRSGGNISSFEWSPDGARIAFTQSADKAKSAKKRKDKFGDFAVEDNEYKMSELWVVSFRPDDMYSMPNPEQLKDSTYLAERKGTAIVKSDDFTVRGYKWSPDGKYIAFNKQPDPLINSFFDADIAIYDMAKKEYNIVIANSSYDGFIDWSPDSKSILYSSAVDNRITNYYENSRLFTARVDGSKIRELALDFDEDLGSVSWQKDGIYATAWQRTNRKLIKIDPKKGTTIIVKVPLKNVYGYSFSEEDNKVVIAGRNNDDLVELYLTNNSFVSLQKLTRMSAQITNWLVADSEVISWKSKDGVKIEGVLHKPQDYDPGKKYPLLVAIHGGPTGISTAEPVPAYVYPIVQWLNKGALVLRPNYRGSAGYGAEFRALNVKNLGVGDAWDVESGVQYLIDQGLVDANKVGSMGWSQGGYISAFLTTNSTLFKAISVGAGISNWITYYVNTDIHPFTRQYLLATPWSDMDVYKKTSPITNINKAQTPTLIQHGEFDRRVPPANAYELYQGLQDVGVDTKLIIYKGFGHGITKPKERLAAVWHNWQWFGKYIWGENIEIPNE